MQVVREREKSTLPNALIILVMGHEQQFHLLPSPEKGIGFYILDHGHSVQEINWNPTNSNSIQGWCK